MGRPAILIIDDEPSVRRILAKVFSEQGYEVSSAGSGEEALDLAEKREVDIALVDLKMPGMDGLETIRWIKEARSGIHFIVITAFGDMESVKKATELDVFDYVAKPFDLEYVKHLVNHIAEGLRPQGLPYSEDMKAFFEGDLSPEEAKRRKLAALKEDVEERKTSLQDISASLDKEIAGYYSTAFASGLLYKLKKIGTNLYVVIIIVGITLGVSFGYFYGRFTKNNVYRSHKKERIGLSDFYRALNELRYWMKAHTEQGLRSEEESKFISPGE